MHRYIVLAQSEATAASLVAARELLFGGAVTDQSLAPAAIIFDPESFESEGGVHAFQILVDRLVAVTRPEDHHNAAEGVVVLVDLVRPSLLSAVAEAGTWNHLIAMLILAFPEIRWAFGTCIGEPVAAVDDAAASDALRFPKEEHDLASLFAKPAHAPLFDPTGLREWVKQKTNEALANMRLESGKRGYLLPKRQGLAAVVDDESDFAFLHAYTAYRYGFRASVVTSWSLMTHLFGAEAAEKKATHPYSLLIEDMRLTFPDKPTAVHLSDLKERGKICPLLANDRDTSKWRFLVTTGQMGTDETLVKDNGMYLKQKPSGRGALIFKPLGGITDLWNETKLYDDLTQHPRHGNASGFVWPPGFEEEGNEEGHGAPGKLALIAKTLLARAASDKAARSASELIQVAVFAMDAAELLGGKTPTLTLSAISLKNEFEVSAEFEFMGAGYHVALERRLEELDAEVASITRWYHEKMRQRSGLEAKTKVLNRLNIVFSEAGRVEEGLECLARMRQYNRKLSKPRNANPLAWLSHCLLSYGEWLLASFPRLIIATLGWLIVFSIAAEWLPSIPFDTPYDTISHVLHWFFGGEPFLATEKPMQVFSWLVILTGVLHIGLLVSYLYSLISRK